MRELNIEKALEINKNRMNDWAFSKNAIKKTIKKHNIQRVSPLVSQLLVVYFSLLIEEIIQNSKPFLEHSGRTTFMIDDLLRGFPYIPEALRKEEKPL